MKRYNQTVLALVGIILPICHGDGIFDSFQASLNEVKNYAADILPYVKEGVQMVQKAEKFVDSAIGEDCSYECDKEGTNPFMLQILIWIILPSCIPSEIKIYFLFSNQLT